MLEVAIKGEVGGLIWELSLCVLKGFIYCICFSRASSNLSCLKVNDEEEAAISLFLWLRTLIHAREDEEGVWVVEHGWIIQAYSRRLHRFSGMELIQGRFNYKTEMNLNRTKEIRINTPPLPFLVPSNVRPVHSVYCFSYWSHFLSYNCSISYYLL